MIQWIKIVYAGDVSVMVPAAAAITAWLAAARAWRTAFVWCALFLLGAGLVAVSKIAYLGWGVAIHSIRLNEVSGHVMLTTAVMPVALSLLIQQYAPALKIFGAVVGMLFGLAMSICVVAFSFHSVAEAAVGYVVGGLVSLTFIAASSPRLARGSGNGRFSISVLVFAVVWLAQPEQLADWMRETALRLAR